MRRFVAVILRLLQKEQDCQSDDGDQKTDVSFPSLGEFKIPAGQHDDADEDDERPDRADRP